MFLKRILAPSILCALVVSLGFMHPVKAAGDVDILSSTGYLDSSGNYHVVGEVQNVGNQAVTFILISAVFYDPQNAVIDTRYDTTMLIVLLVQRKSPFELILPDPTKSAKVHRYSLNITFQDTIPMPLGLQILQHSSNIDGTGRMHIGGQIKNVGTGKTAGVKVVATYYDAAANVVAAASTRLGSAQSDLDPGQTAPFEIVLDEERRPHAITYSLTAESSQYALVSELPTWTSVLIMFAISAISLSIHKRTLENTVETGHTHEKPKDYGA